MLTARNRHFRIAAALAGVAWLLLAVGGTIGAHRIFGQSLPGGFGASAAIDVAANLVGTGGWALVAVGFGAEVDWRRLRIGGTIIASTYIALFAAAFIRMLAVLAHSDDSRYRLLYVFGAAAALLSAGAAGVIVSSLTEARRGPIRAAWLRHGALVAVVAFLCSTVSALYAQADYSHLGLPHSLTVGMTIIAVGTFGTGLAVLFFAMRATPPPTRREAILAGAAAAILVATLCVVGGEVLAATAYAGAGGSVLFPIWIGIGAHVLFAAAFASVALGARTASRGEFAVTPTYSG